MALQYLLDPQLQFSDKSGALSVAGFLRVYLNGTDDLAVTYKDFNGTLNTADIVLDDNGRAVVIADSSKAYRLEVYNRLGGLMWTQYPLNTIAGGAGGADGIVVESTDGSIQVDKYNAGGLVHFDLSTEGAQELEWTRTDNALIEESAEGVFLLPVNQVEGNMTVDCTGILLKANVHYDVSMFINIEAPSTVVNRFEGLQFRVGGPDAPVAAVTFDNSYAHRQVACLSCDVHPQADTRLRVYVEGIANGAVLSCSQCTVHSLAATYTSGGSSEYSAGEGIDIEQNVISVDPTVVQHTLIPGQNITIENNVISAAGGYLPEHSSADEGKCLVVDGNAYGGLSWSPRQDTPLIDVRYRNGQLSDDINTIWEKALKYVYEGRTPILHADFNGDSLDGDLYAGRTRFICDETNLYTQSGLDSAYGYMRFSGRISNIYTHYDATWFFCGRLGKDSPDSTPTISWFRSNSWESLHPWTPGT